MLEYKVRQGQSATFMFWPHTAPTSTPTLTVRHPTAGNLTPAMTQAHAAATVTGIGTDRRTLTVTSQDAWGLVGERGGWAVLRWSNGGDIPVVVESVEATTIVLAAPLPKTEVVDATLEWSLWTAAFTALTVTQTVARMPFTVTWTSKYGGGSMPTEYEYAEGLIYCVRMPFHTGLTHRELLTWASTLGAQVPRAQNSWRPQIETAERVLTRWIRRDLQGRALTEDAVNGAAFEEVHAMLALGLILAGQTAGGAARNEQRDWYMEQARTLYSTVMQAIPWLDADGDGVIDSGETEVANGPRAGWVGGLFSGDSDFDSSTLPVFSRGMSH